MFNLKRDLVFFDVEATGLSVVRDRIVQIGMVKYTPEGSVEEYEQLINPGIPISEEAYKVHGISSTDVANKPTFQQVSDEIMDFIGDADLAGYNSDRYDIPMLMEEFHRVGKEFVMDNRRTVDVQRIFYKMEPRTLDAAYRYYCDKKMENAHDALVDVRATAEVLKGQLDMYEGIDYVDKDGNVIENPIQNDVKALSEFTNDLRFLDATQKIRMDENHVAVFNFGKYLNKPVGEVLYKDRQYFNWILAKEFSSQVKQLVKRLVKEYEQELHDSGNVD
ncbi:MAG: 3'-5' exonuclease [Saprospiraceae bacterium]|nr:3'-5' exonuclease [Saprospiraceae bacterium]